MIDPELTRLLFFVGTFLICATWEWLLPKKKLTQNKSVRWLNNIAIISLGSVLVSVLLPIVAYQAAVYATNEGIGLFHYLSTPTVLTIVFSVLLLDFAIYIQHIVFHRVPILWRLHRVHHADQDIDLTTGSRFHPIEILLSMLIKVSIVIALGIPPIAVVVFEVLLNVSAMFNHSNGKLSSKIDAAVRMLIVTPDMHRVHHSIMVKETHSNFGFFLSVWDKIFGTYIEQPKQGHDGMTIGLPKFRSSREQWLDRMLTQPFRKD
ncbi:sterol desaturase family protein [Vibrio sp. ZSDE26]|uniref:Sterol desaturase family protein n=1 Tax=Vibrio amylolyticus TaxID=2847292 RepID=A0A9X2BJ87_9VIBR|nr:sterol desaturase family protein [Vibrio amylolyticus]MCK6264965.1 sterol desaturase family protein [Vibrio amylolyticus]